MTIEQIAEKSGAHPTEVIKLLRSAVRYLRTFNYVLMPDVIEAVADLLEENNEQVERPSPKSS